MNVVNREVADTRRIRPKLVAAIVAVVLGGLVVYGIAQRHNNVTALKTLADDESVPQVQVMMPMPGPATRAITLPGNIKAWYTAPIYAQVSGYVHKWYVDYGAFVKSGTLLATIDAPTVDEQYQTAAANLEVAKTNSTLADVTAQRWKSLAGTEAVAQEEVDVKVAAAAAMKAQVVAADHEVARYGALEQFKNIVAPFDGVVISRDTDIGNYVNAAGGDVSSRGTADEMFSVADIHEMRLFVSVPQDYADMLKPGLEATFTLAQYPGREFKATLLTTANAFNPQTRTVVAELVAQNPDHLLWPGSYATVKFVVPTDHNVLVVPEQALLFRDQGMQLAIVDSDNRVHLQDVKLGLNLGQNVQVLTGLHPTDRFLVNPSAGTLEGEKVQIVNGVPGVAPQTAVPTSVSESAHPGGDQQDKVAVAESEPK
jgi:membrane fusion protein (multidrug efflux system)